MDMAVESNGIELVSMVAMEDEAEKRAHHNALERKRRDHIKDSFYCLRDAVPQLRGEKASRALILNKATDYIKCLKGKNMCHKKEIDDIKKQNDVLEQEIDKIIKLNNSLGKDRIELLGEEVLALDKATNPQSSPPTFTRITEKDKGPFIGKRNLDQMNIKSEGEEEDEEAGMEVEEKERKDATVTTKITKPVVVRSENVVDNTKGKSPNGPTKQPAKINLAHSGGTILSGSGGTIQIPASALAKALPNGFKNVTAIYKQTGNNKPIRLQIISPNGQSKRFVATAAPRPVLKPSNSPHQQSKEDVKTSSPVKVATIAPSETKELPENKTDEAKEETKEEAKEESKEDEVKSGGLKPLDDPHQPRTPVNQPLYARHRPLHSSPHKDSRRVNSSTPGTTSSTAQDKNANVSEFDSYKTQKNYTGQPNNEFDPPNRGNTRISRLQRNSHVGWSNAAPSLGLPGRPDVLPRDPSAMATISESELAFLTRPTTNSGNK